MRARGKTGNRYVWILVQLLGVIVVHGLRRATIDRVRSYSVIGPLLPDPRYTGTIEVDHDSGSRDGSAASNKITRVLILQIILLCRLEVIPIQGRCIALAVDNRWIGV